MQLPACTSKNASQILRNCRKYAESAKESSRRKKQMREYKIMETRRKKKEEWIHTALRWYSAGNNRKKMSAFYFRSDEKFNFWNPSVASVRCNTPQHQTSHVENCLAAFSIRLSWSERTAIAVGWNVYFLAPNRLHFPFAVSNFSVRCSWKHFHKNYARMNFLFPASSFCIPVVRINYCISCIWRKEEKKLRRANQMKSKRTHGTGKVAAMEPPNRKWSRKIYRRSSLKAPPKTVIFDFMVNPNNKRNKKKITTKLPYIRKWNSSEMKWPS